MSAELAAAYRAGAASWTSRSSVNPWSGTADNARERVLAKTWRRGRLSAVPAVFREHATT